MQERYLRSVEARLVLQQELMAQIFTVLYVDSPQEFEGFVEKMTAGLYSKPMRNANEEEGIELRVAVKMNLDRFAQDVRQHLALTP